MATINEDSISMEFTFEEHDLLNDILGHAIDTYDFVGVRFIEMERMSEDSEVVRKYNLLNKIATMSRSHWINRFNNDD